MNNFAEIFEITDSTPTKSYKKGEIIQHAGDKSIKTFYVKEGLLRAYTIDEKGREHNFMFASEGWIITDVESIEFNEPALLYIESIEPSIVVPLDREALMADYFKKMDFQDVIKPLLKRVAVMQRRIILMMSASAKERYLHFLETYPQLPNRLPQKMIASYLGITPEALSKIRGNMSRNK
ncbi:Crp/Fnr family transcriptional regulator [Brumimicrobium aurantiacum]|uniref:Crp/Fnr family transcriptional regulator n=1 Tax=Brumimicrobium aurantiacum TaxID=1737063 RepID=A0A3E1EXB1_9FLAO|nr:Crp/Fnr family transcriptional regulator [Brumimicrobium aurantiacum]RFC54113.1 Crp/Fnr family transcriptional regulator [Brumimicrobium aurantiacum]